MKIALFTFEIVFFPQLPLAQQQRQLTATRHFKSRLNRFKKCTAAIGKKSNFKSEKSKSIIFPTLCPSHAPCVNYQKALRKIKSGNGKYFPNPDRFVV